MRKGLLSMAIVTALMATGSTAITSHAQEALTVEKLTDGCYTVYVGQGSDELCRILEQLGKLCINNGITCPDVEIPDTEEPDTEAPDVEIPDIEVPDVETPDVEVPDIEIPDTNIPDIETETPDTQEPPAIETPDTQEPEEDSSDSAALSYAEQVVKLVNEERAKAGLPALKFDADITAAANIRAKEIKQLFSHTRPDGSSFSSVLKEQGISYRGSGENIAWGQKSPEQVMNGWMNSAGHRANILNSSFTRIGVGYVAEGRYWTQMFIGK